MTLATSLVIQGPADNDGVGDAGRVPFAKYNAAMTELYTALGAATGAVSPAVITATLNTFTAFLQGLVPPSAGGTANYLRADGTWGVPPGSVVAPTGGNPSATVGNAVVNGVATTFMRSDAAPSLSAAAQTSLGLANSSIQPGFTYPGSISSGQVTAGLGFTPYNATNPAGYITSATVPAAANPTGLIGLAAVNGVATTFMRSDAAPALSQAITPTWTNSHTFSARPAFNLGASVAGGTFISRGISDSATATALAIGAAGNVTINPPGSGNALTVTGNLTATGTLGFNGAPGAAAQTGWGVSTGGAIIANFPGASATLAQCSVVIADMINYLKAIGLFAA